MWIVRNAASARDRFNNAGSPSMTGNSGFSGFGGRPEMEEEESYDKKDDRDRRGTSLNSVFTQGCIFFWGGGTKI